jgi:hypothetical protein
VPQVVERDGIVLLQIERSQCKDLKQKPAMKLYGEKKEFKKIHLLQALQAIAGCGYCSGGSIFWFFLMGLLGLGLVFCFFSLQ